MKLNLACGKVCIPGWHNVDKTPSTQGWENVPNLAALISSVDLRYRWPWADNSVSMITISHLLYCMSYREKIHIAEECYRVLNPRSYAVVRITDDDNDHPQSLYHRIRHHNSVERTRKTEIYSIFDQFFSHVVEQNAHSTVTNDASILQDLHHDGPAIFFLEAIK